MSDSLHITNGDSAANIIKVCGVGGDVLPWRDPMHHGPFLPDLSLQQLSRIRIDYLSGDIASPLESVRGVGPHGFSERDSMLENAHEYGEVVLWFEHDLLDQLQILQLFDWFARAEPFEFKLTLICINEYAGIADFRGIGQLTPAQMSTLYASRQSVTSDQLKFAQAYWSAFTSSEPHALLELLKTTPANADKVSPYLAASLMRHCQEFPWTVDGLTRTERQILKLVGSGVSKPQRIFIDNMDAESCLYIGDWRTYSQIEALCESAQPLLVCKSEAPFLHPNTSGISADAFNEQQLCLTPLGKSVLDGETSVADTHTRDVWLGGVHLNGDARMCFWNEQTQLFSSP